MKKNNGTGAGETPPTGGGGTPLISDETLLELYANLLRSEAIATRGSKRSAATRFAAAAVGIAMDLIEGDTVATGADAPMTTAVSPATASPALINTLRLNGASVSPAESAEQLKLALGAALLHKTSASKNLAVVLRHSAGEEEWESALEAARAHGLPLILVTCAVEPGSRLRKSVKVAKSDKKRSEAGLELPLITVDSNDVVAVYRVAHEAFGRARRGRGGTLIECVDYKAGRKGGAAANAIANMERYLRGRGLLRRGLRAEISRNFERELRAAPKHARR